ncbi:deoxyribodipyrimidine photolyase [Bacillus sp. OxB-1]|nr:deoxyribodipyrimidine photolyase [Bacillus sp. OxB-1]
MKKKTIVWFRNDLRLHDHPALWEASRSGAVIPVYIAPPDEQGKA